MTELLLLRDANAETVVSTTTPDRVDRRHDRFASPAVTAAFTLSGSRRLDRTGCTAHRSDTDIDCPI